VPDKFKTNSKTLNRFLQWVFHYQHVFWILCILLLLILMGIFIPPPVWKKIWLAIKSQSHFIGLTLVFCLVAVSLVWSIGQRIDVWVFLIFNRSGLRSRWLDSFMLCITQMGNFLFAAFVAVVLYLRGERLLAYELIIGILTLALVVQCFKVSIRRTRPYDVVENMRVVGVRNGGHSFPSGHTSQAFFMAALTIHFYQLPMPQSLMLYFIALMVGVSRIYVGMHYPRDVIAGSMLGTVWGILGVIVNSNIFAYYNIV